MFALLLATALSWAPCVAAASPAPPVSVRPATEAPPEDKALKALDAWLKLYRSGKMHLRSAATWKYVEIEAKDSIAVRFGIAPKGGLGNSTWLGDLKLILEAVARLDDAPAAQALLEVAAIGLDQVGYTREMAPFDVRDAGEAAVTKLTSQAARDEVSKVARGELKVEKARAAALQAAAVRCLGATRDPAHRAAIEPLLGAGDVVVRVHAAEALARLGDDAAALALIAALEREANEVVLPALVQALRTVYGPYLPKPGSGASASPGAEPGKDAPADPAKPADAARPEEARPESKPAAPPAPPESTRLAVRAAIKALGRTGWRGDLALLKLLDDFRSAEAVPALIAVLERFRDHPEDLQSGKLSALLQHRAHELLVAMTGAVFPASQPEKWRELWDRDKDKLEVAKPREAPGPGATAASGFCGIPVQGSRVIFILDLSRSMTFKMNKPTGTSAGKRGTEPEAATRLDFAQRELHRAMDSIAPTSSFNLITFNGDEKAVVWSKEMVPATDKNRERFKKHVDKLEALGGTNLWSALEVALKIKSLVYGDRYTTNVDEIFLLSDGAPSVGEVVDPVEILRLVKESNRFAGMRINTVFISSLNPEERQQPMPWMTMTPEELMRRMAEENGGRFVNL